ncbi:MAG TPA: sterol desaturase family protein [Flavobacteriales bacterium]|nr:sterol desaturase family protein [Flavobacteriales bacterium]
MEAIYILFAIPVFLVLIGLELLVSLWLKKTNYRFNDTITNLNVGIGSQAFGLLFKVLLLGFYMLVYENFAIWHQPITLWSFLLAIIGKDFFFYWAHRWGHTVNIFWGAHIVHHQSEEYNLSVALRQSWFHNLMAFPIFIPLPLMGFDPLVFFAAMAAHTLYQFWIHTRYIGRLPDWIEYIFNTPSHHRVHHAIDPKYVDKNYAGVFIIFDRMFGTFRAEEDEPTYGITKPLNSWNPTWANVHYYADMFAAMKQMKWADKLRMIVAKPGWLPEYMGGFTGAPEVDKENYVKYDKGTTNKGLIGYILVQFILILVGISAFMYRFEEISTFYQIMFVGAIVLSMMICGALFENKKWVFVAEYARLLLLLVMFNTFYYFWYHDWFMVMLVSSSLSFVLFNAWFTFSGLMRGRTEIKVEN